MWYLESKTFIAIIVFSLFMLAIRLIKDDRVVKVRKYAFLLFSIALIGFYSKKLLVFSFFLISSNYILFQLILRFKKYKKVLFVLSILYNVVIISVFRFASNEIFSVPLFSAVLLVGLSYTTLKIINLLYNAYFIEEQISIINFCTYLLFVPTFTAGPIMLYQDFKKEIEKSPSEGKIDTEISIKRIIKGFFKKIVMAEILLMLYNYLMAGQLNPITSTAVLFSYYLMGYFDFSGYSDIAIGFGGLMGVSVPENFKKPFSSPSLTQFWRNWHVTLGNWARMHIFMPLAGTNGNITPLIAGGISLVVFAFIGLWHGYNLPFFMWGMYHGVVIFFENIFGITTVNKKKVHPAYFWFRCGVTNMLVAFGEIFLISSNTIYMKKILLGFITF